VSTIETPSINLLDPSFYVDPFAAYAWLRDNDPVHWDPIHRIWGVSRYADIVAVEKNTGLYTSIEGSRPATDQRDDTSMINRDDPEHQQQHAGRPPVHTASCTPDRRASAFAGE